MELLTTLFTNSSKKGIIEALFRADLPEFYLRELERVTGVQYKSLHNDIVKFVESDLVQCRKDGNRNYFRANPSHPIFHDLCSLVEKTSGVNFLLGEVLKDKAIDFAFIFGSIAKKSEKAHSDIDLFIIGKIGLRQLASLLSPLEEKLGREINPHVHSISSFREKLESKNHFISSIVKTQKSFIIGSEDEFRKVCQI